MPSPEIQQQIQEIAQVVAATRQAQGYSQDQIYPRAALVSRIENAGDVRLSSLLAVLNSLGLEVRLVQRPGGARRIVTEADFTFSVQPSPLLEKLRVPD